MNDRPGALEADLSSDDEWDLASEEEPAAAPGEDATVLTGPARRLRALELGLVLCVSFGTALLYSLVDWWRGTPVEKDTPSALTSLRWILQDVSSLAVLAYVLFRQGRSLRQLGLTARRWDIPATIALTVLGFVPSILLSRPFYGRIYHGALAHPLDSFVGGLKLAPLFLLALLVGAAHEELVVRAYLITEVAALTGRAGLAVLASTCFQTLYHFHQGTPEAFTSAWAFLISSIYYASTRRITPVILSHFLYNFLIDGYPYAD